MKLFLRGSMFFKNGGIFFYRLFSLPGKLKSLTKNVMLTRSCSVKPYLQRHLWLRVMRLPRWFGENLPSAAACKARRRHQ